MNPVIRFAEIGQNNGASNPQRLVDLVTLF